MIKDNFYYSLKERLSAAQAYILHCSNELKYFEINKKADKEFFKNNKLIFFFEELINLPTSIYHLYLQYKLKINLEKCLADIKVIQKEISNYEER